MGQGRWDEGSSHVFGGSGGQGARAHRRAEVFKDDLEVPPVSALRLHGGTSPRHTSNQHERAAAAAAVRLLEQRARSRR